MEIRKIIYNGILFFTVVIVVYSVFIAVLVGVKIAGTPLIYRLTDVVPWKGGSSYQKFLEFKKQKRYDVITIGSSHAYRGYDPRIFEREGSSMFNLGTSAQTLLNSYYISKEYINEHNCELVILDIFDGSLSLDGLESTSDLVQNIQSDKAAIEMALAMKDPRAINMLSVRFLNKLNTPLYIDSAYIKNGFSERKDSVKNSREEYYNPSMQVNETQLEYLDCLLNYFTSKKIKVILVSHPLPAITKKANHLKFFKVVNSVANKYNVPYFDYSFSLNFDSFTDFYDQHHLNQTGVEKYNFILINDLKHKGYLN